MIRTRFWAQAIAIDGSVLAAVLYRVLGPSPFVLNGMLFVF